MPDPDLEMTGGGGWGGGVRSPKKFFWPFGPQFGLKMRGWAGASPQSATGGKWSEVK